MNKKSKVVNMTTVVIPTYTNNEGIKQLTSFFQKINQPAVIIDNLPTSEKKYLSENKLITYLPQKENTGFAKAVNLGLKIADSEWVVILNDDVLPVDEKIFEKLLLYAQKNKFMAVSPVLKKEDGTIENLGYRVLPKGRIELNFEKSAILDESKIDGLTAACLLIRKKDFEEIGGFDEKFFAYLEDVDLFLRFKKAGKHFGVCQDVEVVHEQSTTSSKMGNFKEKQDFKNWIRVIMKNWDKKKMIKHAPSIFLERGRNLSGIIKKI